MFNINFITYVLSCHFYPEGLSTPTVLTVSQITHTFCANFLICKIEVIIVPASFSC